MGEKVILLAVLSIFLIILFAVMILFTLVARVWIRAFLGGAPISILNLLAMWLRGNPAGFLVDTLLALKHRGIDSNPGEVETAYIAYKGQPFNPNELADLVLERRDDASG